MKHKLIQHKTPNSGFEAHSVENTACETISSKTRLVFMLVLLVLLSVFDNVKARVVHLVITHIRAFVLRTHNLRFLEKML